MRAFQTTAFLLCGLALSAAAAHADPFDPARVPADAKWVVHVDMDALRPTQLWQLIDDRLVGNESFGAKMGLFEQASGMRFPRDLHSVTLYGRAVGDEAAVVIVHATMNRDQFMAAIQFASGYAVESFGKVDGASWDDNGRQMFGAFHDDSTLVFARSAANIQATLDVMDAKATPLAAGDPLAAGAKQPALAYAAAVDPVSLGKPGEPPNPMLKQIDAGWLAVTERPPTPSTRPTTAPAVASAVAHLAVTAKSADAAQHLQMAAGGLRAMVGLAAMGEGADPNLKFAAAALRSATVTLEGQTLSAEGSVGLDQLEQAVDRAIEKARAKAAADAGDK